MPENDDSDSFLVRWSRRKAGAKTRSPSPQAGRAEALTAGSPEHDIEPEVSGRPDDASADDSQDVPADLVDVRIEALDYEADFTRFLEDDVPEALKRRALRQLWRSSPVLANVDGLNDYDEDFTDAALAVETLKTAYQVGKGYFTDEDEDGEDGEDDKDDKDDKDDEDDTQVEDAFAAADPQADATSATKPADRHAMTTDKDDQRDDPGFGSPSRSQEPDPSANTS